MAASTWSSSAPDARTPVSIASNPAASGTGSPPMSSACTSTPSRARALGGARGSNRWPQGLILASRLLERATGLRFGHLGEAGAQLRDHGQERRILLAAVK